MLLGQVDPALLRAACGADPSFICREALDRTSSQQEWNTILLASPDWMQR